MTDGILVKNNTGHILISSDVESLHYAGKAEYISVTHSGLTDFPNYSGSYDTLDGRCIVRYKAFTNNGTPLFFIRPKDYSRYHGIINQWQFGVYWYVDVLVSGGSIGASTRPDIHYFVQPRRFGNATLPAPTDDYGIVTYKGTTTMFDSRLKPLAITYAKGVTPPADPTNGSGLPGSSSGHPWNYATNDHDFRCSSQYNAYSSAALNNHTDLMFSAPSTAQAVYSRTMYGYKNSCDTYSCQEHWSTAIWWGMYHQAYRLVSGSVRAGWAHYAAGYYFYSRYEDGGWFGGGSGSAVSGSAPYDNKTINLSQNTIIVANASHYE
jgi:hypothetical protein